MDEDEFARALLAHERREWQDPDKILRQLSIAPGMIVADLACGPGFFTIPLAKAVGVAGIVYAVDSSKAMLRYLAGNIARNDLGNRVKVIESDITKTSRIPTSSVDRVFLANILHDITDPSRLFSETRRISKRDSLLTIIDWKKEDTGIGPEVEIRLTEADSRRILKDNSYEVARSFEAGPFHYGLLCKAVRG